LIKEESRSPVVWLLIARPIILSVLLGGEMMLGRSQGVLQAPFFILLASYGLTALYFLLTRLIAEHRLMWVQVVGDVALVSAITRVGGPSDAPYYLLYFLVIIYAALFLFTRGGLIVASLASFFYFLILFVGTPTEHDLSYLAYRVYFHTLFFFLVGAISGFLGERLKRYGTEFSEIGLTTEEILENILAGMISLNGNGRITYCNRRAEEILELSADETRGKRFEELPDRIQQLKDEIAAHFRKPAIAKRKEVEIHAKDGSKKQIGFTMNSFLYSTRKVKGVTVNFQDVTETKYTERLALLGELSASLAHEIRNPLGSIRGATEVLGETLRVEKDTKRLMDLILRESDRVNRKIEEFLFLAKPREPVLRKMTLRRPINQVISLVKYHPGYSRRIRIRKSVGKKAAFVEADEELLIQVFHNISINAINAMEGRGELRISVVHDDDMVGVSFEDTGKGIEPDELDSIFKPFYSGDGKGIGLGLAIAEEIVKQHQGRIEVLSQVGKGSKFIVWLPEAK